VYSFLPGGEQTVRLAYEQAIDKAEHYVYIEDQYAWPCSLGEKLNQAAKRGVKVILVLAHEYDDPKLKIVHNDLRHDDFLDTVRDGAAANVFVYHLQQTGDGPDIYLHAKTMIVDDRWAAIGSTNINSRSHTTDSELQVAVVGGAPVSATIDGTSQMVRPFARNLRLRLWKEHLGLGASSTAVDDPVAGLSAWPSAATPQVHHAVVHGTPSFFLRSPLLAATAGGGTAGALLSWGNPAATITGGLLGAGLAHFIATAVMNRKTSC
jgi:phosphatidylserine/phosphatidylglycerophosphate/cardiolipin synthase-like enzyme